MFIFFGLTLLELDGEGSFPLLLLTEAFADASLYSLRFWKFRLFYLSFVTLLNLRDGIGVWMFVLSLPLLFDIGLDYCF